MSTQNKVNMIHRDFDAEITVPRSAVPFHMASGWTPVDDKVAEAEKDNVPTDVDPAGTESEKDEAAAKSNKRAPKES